MPNDDVAAEIVAESPVSESSPLVGTSGADAVSDAPSARTDETENERYPWLPFALAALVPILLFFIAPPLTRSGLWDPFELNVADLARRIAINLHGASNLILEGANNSLPHLNDLGRPQLPFTSIALGFRYLGLSEWGGRTPLALWGLFGVLSTYGAVARLVDKRAGLYSAVALSTMPLYFVQARTMLGDIVGMSAFAMAVGGLLVALLDRDVGASRSLGVRILWLALGVVGLLAGFYSRGGMIGVGVPLLIIGFTFVVIVGSGDGAKDIFSAAIGALSLLGGSVVLWLFLRALTKEAAPPQDLNPWVGVMLKAPSRYPTFDFVLGQLGPALAPWSAFIPFAMGRLFIPPQNASGEKAERESATKMALLVGAAVTLVAHGWLDANAEATSFVGVSLLAAVCGIALRDYEKGAHPSLALAVGTTALLGLFHHDFHSLPEKAFQAFAVAPPTFPESYKETALAIWTVVLIGLAGLTILTWSENHTSSRKPLEPTAYSALLDQLQKSWDGMLTLGYLATIAGASMAGLGLWIGMKTHSSWVPAISQNSRSMIMNAWWIAAIVPLGVIFVVYFWLDLWLWAFSAPANESGEAKPQSILRGFEPLEKLIERAKEWKSLDANERLGLSILLPLALLQVPAIVFFALSVQLGLRLPIAVAFAVPSGVFVFLVLGAAGKILKQSRVAFFVVASLAAGAVLSGKFYPDLANQLSPKEIFETYQRVHKGNEPLALFGVGGRTAAYYAGTNPLTFAEPKQAFDWLKGSEGGSRRFLAIKGDEIAKLNRMYRESYGGNLPVLDARSSQILLASSSLLPSEKNENPLGKIILSAEPNPQVKLDVNLEDKIQVLGYDITDAKGRLVTTVNSGKPYHLRTYLRALSAMTTDWEMFIHIDGQKRRHNGDHKLFGGKYPCSLWVKDDILMDDHEFKLEPNFTAGAYTIYFGFYMGETRLKISKGPNDGADRVTGRTITVQ